MIAEKRAQLKKHGVNGAKLIAALGALTAAINAYSNLEKQNELILSALATKLNALAEKVSYLEGRLDQTAMLTHPSIPHLVHGLPVGLAVESNGDGMSDAGDIEVTVESDEPAPPEPKPELKLKAYQEAPTTMKGLHALQSLLR